MPSPQYIRIIDILYLLDLLGPLDTQTRSVYMWICRYQLHIGSENIIIYAEGVRPYSLMVGHFTFYEEIGVQFPVGLLL